MVAASQASFAWRSVDAELAALARDSWHDDLCLAGVRDGDTPRLLAFEAGAFGVEAAVLAAGEHRRLDGQLLPPRPAAVEVRHRGGVVPVEADDLGRFVAEGVRTGPVSLRCRVEGADLALVETDWVLV